MAQIVINIPDFLYEQILKKHVSKATIARVFQNGIVLPKGHSELVYREDVCDELRYMDNNGCITRSVNHVIEDIKKGVKTIIEADKN